jgi:hypothetical protein
MDNFTIAVIVGDAIMVAIFVLLIVLDKKEPARVLEPVKPSGKR